MSIKARLALVVATATFLLCIVASLYLYASTANSVRNAIQANLGMRTARIIDQISTGVLMTQQLKEPHFGHDQELILVFDSKGRMIYSTMSPGSKRIAAQRTINHANSNPIFFDVNQGRDGSEYLVLLQRASPTQGSFIVLTGTSLDQLNDSEHHIGILLVIGVPLATLIAGLGALFLAGRALRPVEQLRLEAETLLASKPDGRLKVPKTHDELAALSATLNYFLTNVETLIKKQRLFVASASHELRTPLARISADLELARSPERTSKDVIHLISNASKTVVDLARVCDGLLGLACGEKEHLELFVQRVAGAPILLRILEQFKGEAINLDIDIVLDIDDSIILEIDAAQFARVVENILENALRYSAPGGAIFVTLVSQNQWIFLRIVDQGPGFSDEFIQFAFEPFAQANRVRREGEIYHPGLGLAIASVIVKLHGGRIEAQNAESGGAIIQISLPVAV